MLSHLVASLMLQSAPISTETGSGEQLVDSGPIPEIVVYSRRPTARGEAPASLSGLENDILGALGAAHPNEIFKRVPGAWISRGSGQEHLTAIRSPVLTGAGACGAFLVLEDRVPIRPSGFCNVNELFEVNLLQAQRVDVLRGPGNVVHGSNAVHGSIDASSAGPAWRPRAIAKTCSDTPRGSGDASVVTSLGRSRSRASGASLVSVATSHMPVLGARRRACATCSVVTGSA